MISNKPGMNPQPGNHNFREKQLLFNGSGLMTKPQKTEMPSGNPSSDLPRTDAKAVTGPDFLMSETPRGTASQGQYWLRTKTAFGSKPGQDLSKKPLQEPDDVEEQVPRPMPYNPPQR